MNNVEHNKELIQKYPFLRPRSVWSGEPVKDYDYTYTEWDAIPDGWKISFGDMMLEELGEELTKAGLINEFRIDQIKEKFGELRMYTHGGNKETEAIIDKYSHLSRNICINCGKPDVHMTYGGWIFPCCKECWENNKYHTSPYNDLIDADDDGRMTDQIHKKIYYANGKTEEVYIDIKDTAEKIREHWRQIHD